MIQFYQFVLCRCTTMRIDPLSPKSDQHQFSPKNINIDRSSSREKVLRNNKLITYGKMLLRKCMENNEQSQGEFVGPVP